MKTKVGRPKVAKSKRRGVLIQARISPEENKAIQAAIGNENKSQWIRKALLSVALKEAA
jgi:hypothetical protein